MRCPGGILHKMPGGGRIATRSKPAESLTTAGPRRVIFSRLRGASGSRAFVFPARFTPTAESIRPASVYPRRYEVKLLWQLGAQSGGIKFAWMGHAGFRRPGGGLVFRQDPDEPCAQYRAGLGSYSRTCCPASGAHLKQHFSSRFPERLATCRSSSARLRFAGSSAMRVSAIFRTVHASQRAPAGDSALR